MVAVASATAERAPRAARSRPGTRILWPLLILCALAVAAVDTVFHHGFPEKLWVAGTLDETAHASTALIVVAAAAYAYDRWFLAGLLMGAVLIDADHVPHHLGWDGLELPHTRQFTHSLSTVAVFVAIALIVRGRIRLLALGIAAGLVCHLFRDFAEPAGNSPGVPLLWPLSERAVKLPYAVYAGVLAGLLVVALARRARWWQRRRAD